MTTLTIDGSRGEGGGQVLRSSLALSLITGQAVRLERIRAGRRKPGLGRQHLTAVLAAAEVGRGGSVEGADIGSQELLFQPGSVRAGTYRFDVGTAGSVNLVLQTVLPPLLVADGPSTVTLLGGTHNPMAPPFDFLERVFLPLLGRMGARVKARLERHGFYPAGGGRFTVNVTPPEGGLRPLSLLERGRVLEHRARAVVGGGLPRHIAERELKRAREKLGWPESSCEVVEVESDGPGNVLTLEVESEQVTELFSGFGQKGVRAERVADLAVREARRYLAAKVPVGEHLADQLLLPLALAGGGELRTLAPSSHTLTNLDVLRSFLEDLEPKIEELGRDDHRIELLRRSK
jgi:RNA 3'-terminal phosphate cyclase (ATP)